MAGLFDITANGIERHTHFSQLVARGTLRLAVKQAGLDPNNLTLRQVKVVLEKLMARELERRGVADAAAVCKKVVEGVVAEAPSDASSEVAIDRIFRRLGDA